MVCVAIIQRLYLCAKMRHIYAQLKLCGIRFAASFPITGRFLMNRQIEPFEYYRRGYRSSDIVSPLLWMALGAGIMYLLDPRGGGRRRALIRDKMIRAGHQAADTARDVAVYTRDHVRGYAAEAKARMREGEVPDEILA